MRRGTRRGLIAAAVVASVALVALFAKLYNDTAPPTPAAVPGTTVSPSPSDSGRAPTDTSEPGAVGGGSRGQTQAGGVTQFPTALTNQMRRPNRSGPRHTVELVVTSDGDIARVGYLVPTSDGEPYGNIGAPSAPWSSTTNAYGTSYLAALFIQAGRSGAPVTCRIMIDGVTKSVRTTKGAYERQMCLA